MLRITNFAEDVDWPVNTLVCFLEPGAPDGASVNLTNGLFSWTPARHQAPSTNTITVTVMDNGVPPLSDSNTFHVIVNDYMELTVGATLMPVGERSNVTVTLFCSAPLTNVAWMLDYPAGKLFDWAVQPANGMQAEILATNEARLVLACAPAPGLWLQHTQVLGLLHFSSFSNQPTAFLPLAISAVGGIQPNGNAIPWALWNNGQATVIGNEALLQASADTNEQRSMLLYGKPGTRYQVEYSSDLTANSWASGSKIVLTNFSMSVPLPSTTNSVIFYRAQ
jgi:hypothetical protein